MMPYDLIAVLLITLAIFLPIWLHEREKQKRDKELINFLRIIQEKEHIKKCCAQTNQTEVKQK